MGGGKGHDAWIGASDIETEGRFVYLDGVTVTQQNIEWIKGQPDDAGGNEDCVHFNLYDRPDNRANDYNCEKSIYALCEKRILRSI